MSTVKHVWCSPGGGEPVLGHIVRSSYTNDAGEQKVDVFAEGAVHSLAYREPEDRDDQGAGGTYWNIVVGEEGSNLE